jgi:SEC-C motif
MSASNKRQEDAKLYIAQAKANLGLPGVRWFDGAWSMMLSRSPDGLWGFSACLWPRGRGSTLADWALLGQWSVFIGLPKNCKCLGNTIETQANAVHKWFWAEQGSVAEAMRASESHTHEHSKSPHEHPPSASNAPADQLDFEIKTRGKTPGRNDPCPCGSGKKYKKCCVDRPINFGKCSTPGCKNKAIGIYWCKLCKKGAEKTYPYCLGCITSVRITMQGHCSRVHPEKFPEFMKRIAGDMIQLNALRQRAAQSPELWQAQLTEVEKYVLVS